MAVFSVFHLWAYPWRDYDVRQSRSPTSERGSRVAIEPTASYSGGPFGSRALLDAFNLWDMVKGVGRGLKWCVVGRRIREQDVSYMHSGGTIALQPVRRVFALHFPFRDDSGFLHHHPLSPADDGSQTYIGGTSVYSHTLVNEEDEAVENEAAEEGNSLFSEAQSNSSTSSFLPSPPKQHQIIQSSNQASTNDNSTTILLYEPTVSLQKPCSRAGAPQLSPPEFHHLEDGFEEAPLHCGEHSTLAPPQRQNEPTITEPEQ